MNFAWYVEIDGSIVVPCPHKKDVEHCIEWAYKNKFKYFILVDVKER